MRFKSLRVSCIFPDMTRRRGMTLCACSWATVWLELLCASFCYVMKNHIRIHFRAGQARQLGTLVCFVVTIHLLLLSCPSPSALAHHLSSAPPSLQTTACTMTKKHVFLLVCVFISLYASEMCVQARINVCMSLCWALCVYL